jgi:hypothetical protein
MDEDVHRSRKAARRVDLGRFVVSVDGQAKAGFRERAEADAMADKIRAGFPKVVVSIADKSADSEQAPAG